MKKKIKLHIGENKPPEGWIHIKEFDQFKMLLSTMQLEEIECINFGEEFDSEDFPEMERSDFAIYLVEIAKGKQVPQCFVQEKNAMVSQTIDHYVEYYGFDNYCGKMVLN